VAHSISVHANVPKGGAEGVLLSMGGVDGGFVFYVQKGKLSYGDNYVADQRFKVQSETAIPEGDHIFSFEFTPTGKADIPKGKGIPGRAKALQLNGDLQITSANGPDRRSRNVRSHAGLGGKADVCAEGSLCFHYTRDGASQDHENASFTRSIAGCER